MSWSIGVSKWLTPSHGVRILFASLRLPVFFVALASIALGMTSSRAAAVTVEVAKKCEALTAKAYPPRVIGNPAAGSTKGSGRLQREYFNKCVANGGKMEDNAAK
jgi:hypothetical protein